MNKYRTKGKPYILFEDPNLYVLAGSGDKFIIPVEFIDFAETPDNIMIDGDLLPMMLVRDKENYYIVVKDNTPKLENITKLKTKKP